MQLMLPRHQGPPHLEISQYLSPAIESLFHPYVKARLEIIIVRRLRFFEKFDEVFGRINFGYGEVTFKSIVLYYCTL